MTTPANRRRVLIVIPAYNEEARLEAPLRSYLAFVRARADLDEYHVIDSLSIPLDVSGSLSGTTRSVPVVT